MNVNFQQKMEDILAQLAGKGEIPTLLLHSCCAPCSSAVLERLSRHFRITVFYYNPNIEPSAEYQKRTAEHKRFLTLCRDVMPAGFRQGPYDPESFERIARGREQEREGGSRCRLCYELRLRRTAETAKREGFDYFATTLSVSPYKDAQALNEIGARLAEEYGVPYLFSDFKKKNGYLRSIELSRQYGLYRQDFCGCRYSRMARLSRAAGAGKAAGR